MPVYDKDPEEENPLIEGDSATKKDAASGSQASSSAKDYYKPDDVAAAERGEGRLSRKEAFNRAAEMEARELGAGGFYREERESVAKIRGTPRVTKKRAILAGATVAILSVSTIAVFNFLSGPLALIHAGKLLQQFHFSKNEDFMNGRSARYIRNLANRTPQNNRLGVAGNVYAQRWETKLTDTSGLRSRYDQTTGRFTGYDIVDADKADATLKEMRAQGIPVDENGIDLRDSNYKVRRAAINASVRGTGTNRVSAAISSRLLKIRAGVDFHPFKNIKRRAGDDFVEWRRARKQERSERRKEGANGDNAAGRTRAGTEDLDGEGGEPPTERPGTGDVAEGAEQFRADVDANGGTPSGRSGLSRLLRGGGYATAVVGILCTIKGVGEDIPKYRHANLVLPAMRVGAEIVTAGSQLQLTSIADNDLNAEEVGTLVSDLNTETTGAFTAARSIQHELGEDLTGPDIDAEAKPGNIADKPALFDLVDGIPGLDTACDVSNWFSGIPILSDISDAASSLIDRGLGIFGTNQQKIYDGIVNFFASEAVDTYATGANLGNIANYGMLMAGNDQAISTGARMLSSQEAAQLDERSREYQQDEYQQKSYASRLFDIEDPNSAIASLYRKSPKNAEQIVNFAITAPLSGLKSLMPKALAQGADGYDYGIEEYGFSRDEQDDPRYEDPFENAERVEPRLGELNDRYGKCFGVTIDPNTFTMTTTGAVNTYLIEANEDGNYDDCYSTETEFKDYRFYIADKITELSLVCYEGDEAACRQLGMGPTTGSSPTAGGSGLVDSTGYSFPLAPQTKSVGGTQNGHHDGTPAFDLFSTAAAPVYAIFDGYAVNVRDNYHGISGCFSIQFKANDGFYYWYGHIQNPRIQPGPENPVRAGAQIAEIATEDKTSTCWGGGPHLHIDRGCVINGVPQPGGSDPCRDPDFVPFLRDLYTRLP